MTAENQYTCSLCKETFEKGWTDSEAIAEYVATFTEEEREDVTEVVCDDCYKKIMEWAKNER